jgi:glycerol uptake facilitator-like aquaporin
MSQTFAMILAAVIVVPLLAISLAHLLWSVGARWPIRDEKLLARAVIGSPGVQRMPPKIFSLGIGTSVLVACVLALSLADHEGGGVTLTLVGVLLAAIFLARGIIGYTDWWKQRTPEEPFRTLDRKNYSPLCLGIGAIFLVLVIMRLI